MQVELKAIQREVGITFVFVTHDQDEALTLCDRLAVFNQGRIEQVGAATDVYERPETRFVAGFVGTSNLLERGDLTGGSDGSFALRPEKITVRAPGTTHPDGHITASAVVTEVVYAGSTTRVVATARTGDVLNAVLLNSAPGLPDGLERGADVQLSWPASALRPLSA
jgi:putative spermidine/putrescine transport system ATP-binding protein